MKPEAFLINTSRGQLVDEDALVHALESGKIAGAALDVYDEEPLPAQHRLRRVQNLVLTPHLGYATKENIRQAYGHAVENIHAYIKGKPLRVIPATP